MYLRKEKGYVLINLIYILMLISFFSTVLVTMIINGLKREKFYQYYSKDMKSYNLECEIEELDNYLIVNNTAINYLKNNSDDKVYIRENVFLKYDINKKVFILGNDENYTFLKEDGSGKSLIPYSYRY
ncbi:hypothetical protein [Clostridium paraputrificum]|uniref:hypothetical protein n=1 Tax=Clostridium paraputrificum TaxID=29363 RepID=UPI0006C5CAAA|nr:hypothetical protein [Clostridium paraputrificum]CUO57587.1 Uncharacterised protein [Clostridium paraputrificum]